MDENIKIVQGVNDFISKLDVGRDFVVDEYSIADIAIYPWTARYEWQEVNLADFPNVKRWFDVISARPAVEKAMAMNFAPPP